MDISQIKKQRFGYQDIMELKTCMTYEQLSQEIDSLCQEGQIVPVKNSGKTSFFPSVYREYKKVTKKMDYSHYLPEIRTLHPKLAISRYMGRPEEFVKNRDQIIRLSEYLWKRSGGLPEMSAKERSYEIWRDEKYLESSAGQNILSFNGLDSGVLNYYYAPESFFSTRFSKDGIVLVIENKDTWYSVGRALKKAGTGTFCGYDIAMAVFGEGNKITRDGALTQFIIDEGMGSHGQIYYAGDIDCEGISIFYRLGCHNPRLEILPFLPLYKVMLKRAASELAAGFSFINSPDERGLSWNRAFLEFFRGEEINMLEQVLKKGCMIPQEILAHPDYAAMCRRENASLQSVDAE